MLPYLSALNVEQPNGEDNMTLAIPKLKKYCLIGCERCGQPLYARTDRKTILCRTCGKTIKLYWTKLRVLYTTDNLQEIVQALKIAKTNPRALGKRKKRLHLLQIRHGIRKRKL